MRAELGAVLLLVGGVIIFTGLRQGAMVLRDRRLRKAIEWQGMQDRMERHYQEILARSVPVQIDVTNLVDTDPRTVAGLAEPRMVFAGVDLAAQGSERTGFFEVHSMPDGRPYIVGVRDTDDVCEPETIVDQVEVLPSLYGGGDDGTRKFIPGPRYVRCRVCKRPLESEASQVRGFGRVCAAKVKADELTPRDT